jgi:hypothetical protein
MLVSFDIHKPYCFEKKCLTQEVLSSPREVNWPTNCMWHIPYFSWNLTHLHHTHVLIDPLYYLYIDWFEHLTIMEKKTPVGKVLVCEPRTCELPWGTLRVSRIRSHQILSSNTEVTTSVPECHVNGIWDSLKGDGEGAETILIGQSVPPPLLEWHSKRLKLSPLYFTPIIHLPLFTHISVLPQASKSHTVFLTKSKHTV